MGGRGREGGTKWEKSTGSSITEGAASQVGGDLSYRPTGGLSPNLSPENYSGAKHQTGKRREEIYQMEQRFQNTEFDQTFLVFPDQLKEGYFLGKQDECLAKVDSESEDLKGETVWTENIAFSLSLQTESQDLEKEKLFLTI